MPDIEMLHLTVTDAPADDLAPALTDLSPEQVVALLRDGKTVANARVKRLKFRGAVAYPVRFKNCTLVHCEFDGATFQDEVSFAACLLDRAVCQHGTVFEKALDLSHSVLNKPTFARMTVKGQFLAAYAEFRGKVAVVDCTFEQRASFWEAKFSTWIDIKGCVFHGEADFRSAHVEQGFVLSHSTFHGDFLFRGAHVEKKFQADGSRFEKALDLSKAKLHDFVYLETIEQGPAQTFAFLNALAKRIRVRPEQVEGRLSSERAGKFDDAMQEYGLLKKCYQELHRFDHEDWAFYRFKVAQRKSQPVTWAKPWTVWRTLADYLFLDVGCGYGTNPARAVRMALVIILGFAILYGARVEMFYTEKLPFPDADPDAKTFLANRVMIGLTTSVSVFTSGMGGIREIAQGWMNVPVMIESIMGTLLFGLFIVAFSRKVIR
ncbi:pentapeptide repeat-containing protein [Fimbriiglobus ruber]|uniref:Pentapeptide repeat-containing protein n=1 Tax=Fimbriiglobus ruber TaxID=1908690 RepID=A0A225DQU9_9BACT|nr:pentapeptide repeat-containing protein [Fimbriiglobus ruber]OWK38547.1 hypothetical protein FRUB_07667 [Fimbriiglobus ruber]